MKERAATVSRSLPRYLFRGKSICENYDSINVELRPLIV